MRPIFLYGTLQSDAVFRRVTGCPLPASTSTVLSGWRRGRMRDAVYPGIVPCQDSEVTGVVVSVDSALLDCLDQFEGPQYERKRLIVASDGIQHHVEAYTVRRPYENDVLDELWSLDCFVECHLQRFLAEEGIENH